MIARVCLAAAVVAAASITASSQERPLRGFTADTTARQQQREEQFRGALSPQRIDEHLRAMSAKPHWAGGPGSREVAEYALAQLTSYGLDAWIEEHEAYMPLPVERSVRMVLPEKLELALAEPPIADDPDTSDEGQLPTYNAYSADGDVTADLVYVNYGIPEDYARLRQLGISVKGKIVLARYGRSWRGIKPKVAWEHGAVGCIIYSDPRDDGYWAGDVYPKGAFRPELGAQRGSVMDMPVHPGDPLTPGWGSEKGGRKLDVADAKTILKIPVLPIGYADALPLLKALGGPVAPPEWRGALPVTYHIGPGRTRVQMKLKFDWQQRPLYNVIARIKGSTFPDEWIIYGNHHDAWVNGAQDPTSGAAVVLETARGLGELVKAGWAPQRTLLLALWDGEEWGLLGSTEWAEKHRAELADKAVAYLNTDSNGKGWLSAGGSHSLQQLVNEVTRDVPDPRTGAPVRTEARTRAVAATPERARPDAERDPALRIAPLGSGSDYTAFLQHLTIASLNLGFGGEDEGGIYHSIYDTYKWYTRFSDGDFTYGRALAQTVGTLLLRLAEAPVLPFQFTDYASTIGRYVGEIQELQAGKAESVDLTPIRAALSSLQASAAAYEAALDRFASSPSAPAALSRIDDLKALNALLFTSERRLALEAGLPRRDWFKHAVYAPGFYTGYGVKTLPALREGIEEGQWAEARAAVPAIVSAIQGLGEQVDRATAAIGRLASGPSSAQP